MESSRARPGRRARPSRRRPLLHIALAAIVIVGGTAMGTVYVKAQAHSDSDAVSSSPSPSATSSPSADGEASVEPVTEPSVDRGQLLADALTSVTVPSRARVSAAVLDLESGESAAYGDAAFDTASIVKVDILATLLLQAQDAGRHLTATEKTYATAMIENSDNASASALWKIIGEAAGLDAANKRFGLTDTTGGDGMLWGLTRTTAADQLTLLQQVFGDDAKLSAASQAYVEGLMRQIAADQHWGVSAAADVPQPSAGGAPTAWALKNGWLARSTTGLWDINSIGRVTVDGHDYLVTVLSDGNATQAGGISLVEKAARAAVSAFTGGDGESSSASAAASPSSAAD
ncbi:serine hydrolase [Streptomyces sp. NPDC059766]|uniref:serine hydrolase n=1 Tax=Streptomyces sp. NPDC059766 TaxID=3346940 RepID=UPI00364E38DC